MKKIVLTTLNSRYSHTSIALRYLFANLKELKDNGEILEFVINEDNQRIAEQILECNPKIVGIGVYIWNAVDVAEIVKIIKKVSPQTVVVLGGPEVSHIPFRVDFGDADFIIAGEGEVGFYELCKKILNDEKIVQKSHPTKMVNFTEIALPYQFYDENDIKNRHIYIEASRGCPFHCEFCLSSIDNKMRYLEIDILIAELENLWVRGARNFKFIDRTFNINIGFGTKLLEYFLSKEGEFFVHFEVIPDNFPEELKELLKRFKPAQLQLEVGIQTLNIDIAKNIKRNLKIEKIKENIRFLATQTNAHLHLDLIVGLPGESLERFGANLDELIAHCRSEIQIGILKKLSGTSLNRHDEIYGMIYSDKPPYDILQNNLLSFKQVQKMKRFARFWDIVYNSGNFKNTIELFVIDGKIFDLFLEFTDFVYSATKSTNNISPARMGKLIYDFLTAKNYYKVDKIDEAMALDIPKQHTSNLSGATQRQAKRV